MARWVLAAGVVAVLLVGAVPAAASPGDGNGRASVTTQGDAFVQVSAQGGDVQVTVMDGWREKDYSDIHVQVKDKVVRTADPPCMMFADAF